MVFIWDNKDSLFKHLLEIFPDDKHTYICNFEELKELTKEEINEHEGIVVLAELSWTGIHTNYLGFNVIWQLRMKDILAPVIMVSRSFEHFFKSNLEYYLIKDPSLSFCDYYTFLNTTLQFRPPLHQDVNRRLISSSTSVDRLIRSVLHGVKGKLIFDNSAIDSLTDDEFIDSIKTSTSSLIEMLGRLVCREEEVEVIQQSFYTDVTEKLESLPSDQEKTVFKKRLPDFFKSYSSKIDEIISSKKKGTVAIEQKGLPFRAIFLDDENNIRERIAQEFNSRYCFQQKDTETGKIVKSDFIVTASTPQELFNTLDKDISNHINLVICDYHLEDEHGKLMAMQGSTVLKELYNKSDKLYLFVALSSLGKSISEIQREYSFKVLPFHKELVFISDIAFSDFADRVVTEATHIYSSLLMKPQTKSWREGVGHNRIITNDEIDTKTNALAKFLAKEISLTRTKKQAFEIASQIIKKTYAIKDETPSNISRVLESQPLWQVYRLYRSAINYSILEKRLNQDARLFVEQILDNNLTFEVPIPYSENILPTYDDTTKINKFYYKLFCRRIIILLWFYLVDAHSGTVSAQDSQRFKRKLYNAVTTGSLEDMGNSNVVNGMNFNLGLKITRKLNSSCLIYEEIQLLQSEGYDLH